MDLGALTFATGVFVRKLKNCGCIYLRNCGPLVRVVLIGIAAKERAMDHKVEGVADKAKGTAKDIRGKQPEPTFDKPLGSSHNDEADLRDVAQEAAKRSW